MAYLPPHVRETAVWLYVRHELSYQEVADRLFVDESSVRSWVAQRRVGRSRMVAARLRYKNPDREAKKIKAFHMSERGMKQQDIADVLGVSQYTISKYVNEIRDFRNSQHIIDTCRAETRR